MKVATGNQRSFHSNLHCWLCMPCNTTQCHNQSETGVYIYIYITNHYALDHADTSATISSRSIIILQNCSPLLSWHAWACLDSWVPSSLTPPQTHSGYMLAQFLYWDQNHFQAQKNKWFSNKSLQLANFKGSWLAFLLDLILEFWECGPFSRDF